MIDPRFPITLPNGRQWLFSSELICSETNEYMPSYDLKVYLSDTCLAKLSKVTGYNYLAEGHISFCTYRNGTKRYIVPIHMFKKYDICGDRILVVNNAYELTVYSYKNYPGTVKDIAINVSDDILEATY